MSRSEPAGTLRDPAASPVAPPISYQALGTTVTVVVHGAESVAAAAVDAVRAEVAAIDAACSRFRDDSELSRANALAGHAVPVGPLLLEAVEVALRAARITGGLVDPTLGRQLRVLGYDRDFSSLPTSMLTGPSVSPAATGAAGASEPAGPVVTLVARSAPAWEQIRVDRLGGTITVPDGVELDLGATAKALAVDRATAAAARAAASAGRFAGAAADGRLAGVAADGRLAGVAADGRLGGAAAADRLAGVAANGRLGGAAAASAGACGRGAPGVLVSIGGDLAVAGTPPTGGWTIRVADDHKASDDEPGETIAITGGALATSGTTVRRWYRGTTPVHHLLDPATGLPAAPVWRTVSVAAATCVDANTASTAAMILGRQAPDWLAAQGLPARLVTPNGDLVTVSGWPT